METYIDVTDCECHPFNIGKYMVTPSVMIYVKRSRSNVDTVQVQPVAPCRFYRRKGKSRKRALHVRRLRFIWFVTSSLTFWWVWKCWWVRRFAGRTNSNGHFLPFLPLCLAKRGRRRHLPTLSRLPCARVRQYQTCSFFTCFLSKQKAAINFFTFLFSFAIYHTRLRVKNKRNFSRFRGSPLGSV